MNAIGKSKKLTIGCNELHHLFTWKLESLSLNSLQEHRYKRKEAVKADGV